MKIILSIFFFFSYTHMLSQVQHEPSIPESFTITDYSITGLTKKHVLIVANYSDYSIYIHQTSANEKAGIEFYVSLDEKYNLFDLNKEITGATGNTSFGSTTLRYDKNTYIKYKYGYDNEELMNDNYNNYYDNNKNKILIAEPESSLLKHLSFTIQVKVDNQIVKFRINLNNPAFHQFLLRCKTYTDFKKAQENAASIAKEEEAKAKVIAEEDSIRKAYEEFRSKYGYLFTSLGTKPDKFILDNIDVFIANFNHGNKIPMDAIFNDNPSRIYIVYPNCVILKTNKAAVFYDRRKIESSVEIGVLPKGKLIKVQLGEARIRQIGAKKYLSVSLELNDPWWICQKPKYQLQDQVNGLILLESLEFGNASDIEDFRAQVKEFGVIQRNSWKGIKIPCEEIVPKN